MAYLNNEAEEMKSCSNAEDGVKFCAHLRHTWMWANQNITHKFIEADERRINIRSVLSFVFLLLLVSMDALKSC